MDDRSQKAFGEWRNCAIRWRIAMILRQRTLANCCANGLPGVHAKSLKAGVVSRLFATPANVLGHCLLRLVSPWKGGSFSTFSAQRYSGTFSGFPGHVRPEHFPEVLKRKAPR